MCFHQQALHNENMSMKADIQNLQAQISDQVSFISWLFLYISKVPTHLYAFPLWHYLYLTLSMQAASQLALDQFQKRWVGKIGMCFV